MASNQQKFEVFNPESLELFPERSGVYLMKDSAGKILYIGKAINIRARLRNYFSKTGDGRPSVDIFLPKVSLIDTVVTNNEKEAFLLENILIKKEKPPYNIQLKDDKTHLSLRIDLKNPFPRLEWTRRRRKDGALYFGPYSSSAAARNTVRMLEKIFPLRTCPDTVMKNRTRPCIRYQMRRCLAPCTMPVSQDEYMQIVNGAVLYLRGNVKELIGRLRQRMEEHAASMRFEQAADVRDKIAAIDATMEKQNIADERARDLDVFGHHIAEGQCCIASFQYRLGVLAGTRTFIINQQDRSPAEIYYAIIGQYYNEETFIPSLILTGEEPDERELLEEALSDIKGARATIAQPQRGKSVSLLKLAMENAREHLKQKLEGSRDLTLVLQSLQDKLGLPETPALIEGFDISNIQGRMAVGSMVVFQDGQPAPARYRHFKIKSVIGSNDFAMMYEVVRRRYKRVQEENLPMPNLILIDGGNGQLAAACRALEELGLRDINIIGLAKRQPDVSSQKEKSGDLKAFERVFLPNRKNPIILKPGSPALFLIDRVRDEAHRFAITFHKKLRSKGQRYSALDDIPGIGPSRKRSLLRHFGSLEAIKKAAPEELAAAPGIPAALAEQIHAWFVRNP